MVSARSTVSIARTTPAQKPRGEHSTIFKSGLAGTEAVMGDLGTESPHTGGQGRSIYTHDLGLLSGSVKAVFASHCAAGPGGHIRGEFPSSSMTRRLATRRGWQSTKEI